MKRHALVAAWALFACAPAGPRVLPAASREAPPALPLPPPAPVAPPPALPPAASIAPPARSLDEELGEALRARVLSEQGPVPSVLYNWTTAESSRSLRATGVLLTAHAGTSFYVTPFNRLLRAHRRERSTLGDFARLLLEHPVLRYRRYAWTAPLATVMGLGSHRYGNTLVGIELRPEALVATLDPQAREPLRVRELSGAPVPLEAVLADPRRLAAVYHLRTGADVPVPFREVVLVNETMVARFSIGTERERRRVTEERELLQRLRGRLQERRRRGLAPASWRAVPEGASLTQLWDAVMAFDNEAYRVTPAHLDAVAEELSREDPAGAPYEHAVTARWY